MHVNNLNLDNSIYSVEFYMSSYMSIIWVNVEQFLTGFILNLLLIRRAVATTKKNKNGWKIWQFMKTKTAKSI